MIKISVFLLSFLVAAIGLFAFEGLGLLLRYYGLLKKDSRIFEPLFIQMIFRSKYKKIRSGNFRSKKKDDKIHHKEIMKVLLGLDDEKMDELLELYQQEFGKGAARYARKTYRKWESNKVKPITQTFERFLVHLPKVMDFDLKCEVLRHLMEEYCAKDNYDLTVYTDTAHLKPLRERPALKFRMQSRIKL